MSMSNPIEATLALDGLPVGARIVACKVDDDGTASGILYEHRAGTSGKRHWKDMTGESGQVLWARDVIENYDDMVICHLPERTKGSGQ